MLTTTVFTANFSTLLIPAELIRVFANLIAFKGTGLVCGLDYALTLERKLRKLITKLIAFLIA
jgi:hypothetical protein